MLKTGIIPLTGGLDYSNTKTLIEPGKLSDCLNYDTGATFGYGLINGFFRWDGASPIKDMNIFGIEVQAACDLQSTVGAGAPLYTVDHKSGTSLSSGLSDSFGLIVGYHNTADVTKYWVLFVYTDTTKSPTIGDTIDAYKTDGNASTVQGVCSSNPVPVDYIPEFDLETGDGVINTGQTMFNDLGSSVGHYYPGSAQWAPKWFATFESDSDGDRVARGTGTTLMQNLPVIGLHSNDTTGYAVANLVQMTVRYLANQLYPGDIVYPTGSPVTPVTYYQVVNATLVEGTWTGTTVDDKAVLTVLPLYKRTSDSTTPNGRNRSPDVIALQDTGITWAVLRGGNGNAFRHITLNEEGATPAPYPSYTVANLRKSFSEEAARTSGNCASLVTGGPALTVSAGGTGYTSPPRIEVTGDGFGATAVARISAGAVVEAVLTNPGYGYTTTPTFTVTGGGGSGATVTGAGLWEQQEAGWHNVHHGWLINFDAGTSASGYLTRLDRSKLATNQTTTFTSSSTANTTVGSPNTILTDLDFDTAVRTGTYGWYSSEADQSMPGSLVQSQDDTNYVWTLVRDSQINYNAFIPTIGFVDFNTIINDLPQNATIRGIQVDVDYDTNGGFSSSSSTAVPRFRLRATLFKTSARDAAPSNRTETRIGQAKEIDLTVPTGSVDVAAGTLGGDNDLWGALGLKYDDLKDPNFGVALDLLVSRAPSTTCDFQFRIDRVRITVHYNDPSVRYYFSDGAGNVLAGDLVDYELTSGDLRRGDAKGVMQVANLHPIAMTNSTTTSSMTVKNNYNIYMKSDLSAGSLVAVSDGEMVYNGLESRKAVADNKSRYQLISGNFYANADWESIFGVSGAGRAFEYDGKYFRTIYAIDPGEEDAEEKDKPRHIAKHKYRLALGYASGSVALSSVVDPAEFSGLLGATEIGIGDRITGLSSLSGSYLAVFGQNSIHGIAEDDLDLRVISGTSGCVEYSLANTGNEPMFCDSQGISTIESSDKYGDFVKRPLSTSIYPWLLPRLTTSDNPYLGGAGSGLVTAYAIRNKSQYVMWFADGHQLVLGLAAGLDNPQFTLTRYFLPKFDQPHLETKDDVLGIVRPLAISSQMSASGEENIFFSVDLWSIGNPSSAFTEIDYANYVYKMDYLDYFDCGVGVTSIPAYIQTQYWNKEDPYKVSTIYKTRLEGQSRKYAPLKISLGADYDNAAGDAQDISLHEASETGLPISPVPRSKIASCKKTARTSTIKLESKTTPAAGFTLNVIGSVGAETFTSPTYAVPQHHLQTLLLQHEEGRDDA